MLQSVPNTRDHYLPAEFAVECNNIKGLVVASPLKWLAGDLKVLGSSLGCAINNTRWVNSDCHPSEGGKSEGGKMSTVTACCAD